METTKTLLEQAEQITALVETTGTGITNSYVEIPVEMKDEKTGEKKLVNRKIYNELAVNALVSIEQLLFISGKSTKGLVLGMAKLTKAHAESVGLKSVKALLHNKFGKMLDVNTIEKYRRIGLLFSADRKDANNYEWRDGIDPDVSVSNLDAVMTLFGLKEKKINLEICSDAELDELFEEFYGQYIVLDKIHLLKSQKDLKAEVHDILHPVIDVECVELDEQDAENGEQDAENGEQDAENGEHEETTAETALQALTTLQLIFKGNKDAEKALKKLSELVNAIA